MIPSLARYIAIASLLISSSCSAAKTASNDWNGYAAAEKLFLVDAEQLLFGDKPEISPIGGEIAMQYAVRFEGVCITRIFRLAGGGYFQVPNRASLNPLARQFGKEYQDDVSRTCDIEAFYSILWEKGQARSRMEIGNAGQSKEVTFKRSQIFIDVSFGHRPAPFLSIVRTKSFQKHPECRIFERNNEGGGRDVFISFDYSREGERLAMSADYAQQTNALLLLSNSRAFTPCLYRGMALAQGFAGATYVPDRFFPFSRQPELGSGMTVSALGKNEYVRASGCRVVSKEFRFDQYDGLWCTAPRRPIFHLNGIILRAMDDVDPEATHYSRAEFRQWIRTYAKPGSEWLSWLVKDAYRTDNRIGF